MRDSTGNSRARSSGVSVEWCESTLKRVRFSRKVLPSISPASCFRCFTRGGSSHRTRQSSARD
eukprot:scaffold30470_cov71-Isochrysis_galbana.AAC.2